MRRFLLVTGREYRRMLALPAFWIVSLIVPVFALVAPVAQNFLGKPKTVAYVLVDKPGNYREAINRRLELDYQRQVLVQLRAYLEEWRTSGPIPGAQTATQMGSSSTDTVVADFLAAGGAPALLRHLKPYLSASAPPFQPPPRPLVEIPIPKGVNSDTADQFGASIGPHFEESIKTSAGSAALSVTVYIPGDVDSGGQVRVWTNSAASTTLVQDLKIELTQSMRLKALHAAGLDPLSAARIEGLSVSTSIAAPEMPAPSGKAFVHSVLPFALAYLLLISMMITGSMMLQGLVEERSNKLVESVLACVTPRELMIGKLIGISAIGLSIIAIWVSATVAIAKLQPSSPLGFLVPALVSLGHTPGIAAAMLFYFLAGYLTMGMIFLAMGVLADSMQEAQVYLMPLTFIFAVPSALLASAIHRDPNGLAPRIFSWIPLYTPVMMLARLQSGVSRFDLFGTAAVLLLFGALELFLLSRLFENNLIQTSRGFHFAGHIRQAVRVGFAVIVVAVVFGVRHHRASTQSGDQVAARRSRSESVFKTACASCHDPAVGRAPSRQQLASLAPEVIVTALTSGSMKPMAAGLSSSEIRAVATYLTGRQPATATTRATDPAPCPRRAVFRMSAGGWNGWSIDPRNWRFQPEPGIGAAQIPHLKVKWAFTYPGGNYGQPTLVGGRLFLTSRGGSVYSLDANTGCLYWRFAQSTPSRTTVSVGPLPRAGSGYAAYFGDRSADVYALDAESGALVWKTRVDSHPRAILTGSPTLFKGRLYVPVSSDEEGVATLAGYSCCTFRGNVVALDAVSGNILWKTFAINQPPAPTTRNSAGTQMYGPAGAAVWSSPTVDAKRGRLYFATGNSYTDAKEGGSDAVVGVDLESGRTIWRRQVTENDNDLSGCTTRRQLVNCPTVHGHDYDFGASPILVPLANGKGVLLAGQKSGAVLGLDPDSGTVLWRTQVGVGGFLGGVEWGMASDGRRLYVANADAVVAGNGRPGLFALDLETGKDLWYTPSPKVRCSWTIGAACFNAQSAAPFAIPGVIFSGTTDGHERAYTAVDGRILWDFDSARGTYHTINGIDAQAGGSIDVSSGSLANGMLYLISGRRGILGGGSTNVLLAFSIDGR